MTPSLLKSTATVGGMTLISRVLGFLRDMVFARAFGAAAGMDAFFVAFKIPNFLRRLFAEGAFSQAFVPVLAEYRARESAAAVRDLVARVSGTLAGMLLLLSLAGAAGSPVLVAVFAPGFLDEPARFGLTRDMLRVTFPYILFISLVAFAAGILNSHGRFAAAAFAPVLLNLVLIVAALGFAPHFAHPEMALAWGVLVGGVLQLLFVLPGLRRLGLLPRPRWGWRHPGVQRVMRLMLPAIFGSSVVQINLLFDTLIASFLAAGSVSWLYYSDRLVEFPLGVFGIALSTVVLPSLSRSHAGESAEEFSGTLDWALRLMLLGAVPATVGLFVLAGPVVTTLFQYDQFTVTDVRMAALSLMAYTLGLPGFMLVKVLAPGFYARQDTRTPVRIGVIAMLANMALNLVFVIPMALAGVAGPHAGLALATSLAAYVNAGLLLRRLRRDGVYRPGPGWRRLGMQLAAAGAVMGLGLWLAMGPLARWLAWPGATRALWLTAAVAAGAAGYLLLLWLLGVPLGRHWRALRGGAAPPR